MFDSLSEKMLASFKRLRGQSKISESNIQDAIKDIRLSLLEADVNYKVVKTLIDRVKEKALGSEVLNSLTAGQQFTKIVHDELVTILGGGVQEINVRENPSVIFLVGLQGVGKTTTAAKLALFMRKTFSKKVGLVPADVYRPAAIEQLRILGSANDFLVFPSQASMKPEQIASQIPDWAKENMIDVLIVDTAGRLQVDEQLMSELVRLKDILPPQEILLVADAMLGQQAVNVALGFHERLHLSGLILTKVDGDARGGAALSIREATGIPIKFLGVGEKVSALEVFHPDRLVSRLLDMGDILSLVEKAHEVVDQKQAQQAAQRLAKNQFSVEDFLAQIRMMKKMGGMEGLLKFLPGMGQMMNKIKTMTPPDQEMKKIEAIICSMTLQERQDHNILNGSRRLRIAKGSGVEVSDVNRFIRQFEQARKMMSQMMKMGLGGGRGLKLPF